MPANSYLEREAMRPTVNTSRHDPAWSAIRTHAEAMDVAKHDAASLDALARDIEKIDHERGVVPRAAPLDLSKSVLDFPTLLCLKLPERTCYVPWLPAGGIVMIYGPRGVGKTMFTIPPAG